VRKLRKGHDLYLRAVATWDSEAEITHPVDYRLVHNTFVTMFWRTSLLDETVQWLRAHGYDVVEFDAAAWGSPVSMLDDVAAALDFPDHFGRNLDALNDCMADVASGEYGWRAEATGLVMVLKAFDTFTAVDRRAAQIMLDIFAQRARSAILLGNRIICLVQSNDPALTFQPVGSVPVVWNEAESLNSKRGI